MTRVSNSIAIAFASLALTACQGGGFDLSEIRPPDQRSVNDTRHVYHRPNETPAPAAADPSLAATPPAAPGGDASGGTGWAEAPEPSRQPPVFAPSTPSYEPPPTPVVAAPPPAPYGTAPAPAMTAPPQASSNFRPPSHTTSTLPPPPPPPTISSPGQLAPAAGTSDSDPLYFNFMGQIPPELSSDGSWVTPPVGQSLAALRGQVVFLVFSFQGCEGCKIFMPTLQQWAETYQRRGATILYIDNGAIDPLDYAKKAMQEQRSTYAYFHDAKANTVKSYGVRSFPTAYLLNKQGRVIWQGCPTAREGELMPLIEAELAK